MGQESQQIWEEMQVFWLVRLKKGALPHCPEGCCITHTHHPHPSTIPAQPPMDSPQLPGKGTPTGRISAPGTTPRVKITHRDLTDVIDPSASGAASPPFPDPQGAKHAPPWDSPWAAASPGARRAGAGTSQGHCTPDTGKDIHLFAWGFLISRGQQEAPSARAAIPTLPGHLECALGNAGLAHP